MNRTAKNTVVYLVGTILSAVVGFLNTMLLTRVLDEQVYAMYGLLATFVTAATTFIAFGYDSAYSRFYYKHGFTQKQFIWHTLRTPMIVFSVFALVLLEPNHFLLNYVFETSFGWVTVLVLLVYVFFSFLHRFTQLTARMEERAFNYVASNLIGKFGYVVLILIVFFLAKEVSFDWVVISFLISSALAALLNAFVFIRMRNERNESCQSVTEKDLFSYGFPYMLNNLIILIVPLWEKLIIRDLAGWQVLSIYTAAAIFQTVIMIISNTVINIWNPLVYKHCDDEARFKPILHMFGVAATIVVVAGLAFCILLRRWLVLLLDSNYYSVYIIAPAVLFGACFNVLNIIYSVGINIKKKTGYFIVSPLLQLGISVGLCYCLVPTMGLIGVAIATLASLVISKTYRIMVGMHFYNTGVSEWKTIVLCTLGVSASVFTLFSTSLISDVFVFVGLMTAMALLINKDAVQLVRSMKELLRNNKKENAEVEDAK